MDEGRSNGAAKAKSSAIKRVSSKSTAGQGQAATLRGEVGGKGKEGLIYLSIYLSIYSIQSHDGRGGCGVGQGHRGLEPPPRQGSRSAVFCQRAAVKAGARFRRHQSSLYHCRKRQQRPGLWARVAREVIILTDRSSSAVAYDLQPIWTHYSIGLWPKFSTSINCPPVCANSARGSIPPPTRCKLWLCCPILSRVMFWTHAAEGRVAVAGKAQLFVAVSSRYVSLRVIVAVLASFFFSFFFCVSLTTLSCLQLALLWSQ